MKHIKLFEKFESKEITSILSFLKKKINGGDFSYNAFLKYLKADCDKFDIPVSSLSGVKYLKRNDALNIKGEANNEFGVIAIVYWFSINMGYLVTTYLSNDNQYYTDRNLRYKLNNASIENADFTLVVELDDILIDMYDNDEKLSDIRSNRSNRKKDATALLSDKEIRTLNIERYIAKTYSKFGIDKSGMNLANLNQLIIGLLSPKTLGYYMYVNPDKIYNLEQFTHDIYNFILYQDEYYYNSSISLYKRSKKEEDKVLLFKKNDVSFKRVTDILDKIGDKIYKKISSMRIKSISDMHLISRKLEVLESMMQNEASDYKISSELRSFLRLVCRNGDKPNYVIRDSDIKKLESLYDDLDEIF